MKINLLSLIIIAACFFSMAGAGDIKNLDEARNLSAQAGKPVLLEFYKDDCEYCSKMAQDAINNESVKQALNDVIYYKVMIKSDYGKKLSERYKVGIYFPAFFLLNSNGEIIKRWTGYTTPSRFISTLNLALADRTTVEQRIARFKTESRFDDAIYLAEYFTEIMDYPNANYYYDQARKTGNRSPSVYVYEIFQNTANSAWQDSIPFGDVFPAADTVLYYHKNNAQTLIKVAQIMSRLGRKLGAADQIGKYLQAAIKATENAGGSHQQDNLLLKAEYALYIDKDIPAAIRLKKSTMPAGWENIPDQFYGYAKWCLEREIALTEAEGFARKAMGMASPGEFKGKVLNTLALICEVQGKYEDAVQFIELAIKEDPKNEHYPDKLAEFKSKLGG